MTDKELYIPFLPKDGEAPSLKAPQQGNLKYAWSFIKHDESKLSILFDQAFTVEAGGVVSKNKFLESNVWNQHQDKIPDENMFCLVYITLEQKYTDGKTGPKSCMWFDKDKNIKGSIQEEGVPMPPDKPIPHWPTFSHEFFPTFQKVLVFIDGDNKFYFHQEGIGKLSQGKHILNSDVHQLEDYRWYTQEEDKALWGDNKESFDFINEIKDGGEAIINFKKWSGFAVKDNYMEWVGDESAFYAGLRNDGIIQSNKTINPNDMYNSNNIHAHPISDVFDSILISNFDQGSINPVSLKMYPNSGRWDGVRHTDEVDNKPQYFSFDFNDLLTAKSLNETIDDVPYAKFPVFDEGDSFTNQLDYTEGYIKINRDSGEMSLSVTMRGNITFNIVSAVFEDGSNNPNGNWPFFPTFSLKPHPELPDYYEVVLKINHSLTSYIKAQYFSSFDKRANSSIVSNSNDVYADAVEHGVSYCPIPFTNDQGESSSVHLFVFGFDANNSEHYIEDGSNFIADDVPSLSELNKSGQSYIGYMKEPANSQGSFNIFFIAYFTASDWANKSDNPLDIDVSTDSLFSFWPIGSMERYDAYAKSQASDPDEYQNIFDLDELKINALEVVETTSWVVPVENFVSALHPNCYERGQQNKLKNTFVDSQLVMNHKLVPYNLSYGKHI